jgi:hypothetical protein
MTRSVSASSCDSRRADLGFATMSARLTGGLVPPTVLSNAEPDDGHDARVLTCAGDTGIVVDLGDRGSAAAAAIREGGEGSAVAFGAEPREIRGPVFHRSLSHWDEARLDRVSRAMRRKLKTISPRTLSTPTGYTSRSSRVRQETSFSINDLPRGGDDWIPGRVINVCSPTHLPIDGPQPSENRGRQCHRSPEGGTGTGRHPCFHRVSTTAASAPAVRMVL